MKAKREILIFVSIIIGVLLLCPLMAGLAAYKIFNASGISSMYSGLSDELAPLQDDEYAKLSAALAERLHHDNSIEAFSTGLTAYGGTGDNKEAAIWLEIEISHTGPCNSTSNDPCEELADELARIVFDNYSHVDKLTGIRINITNYYEVGSVELSNTFIDKDLTIEEWRKELDIQK